MRPKEIRMSDKGSISEKILEIRKELVKLNAQISSGSAIKNPGQVSKLKKTLARIYTIQTEKKDIKAEMPKKEEDKKA